MHLLPNNWVARPNQRLTHALQAWAGTPYGSGQGVMGGAADCIGSVFGIIDWLDGVERDRASLPADVALHDRPTAIKAMLQLMRTYGPTKLQPGADLEPGDLVVVGQHNGGPGHIMIVGTQPNTLWDSQPLAGFQMRGWGLTDRQVFHAAFRPNKSKW